MHNIMEYIDNYNKLHETELPPQDAFHSGLNNSSCNDEDYKGLLLLGINSTTIQFRLSKSIFHV